MNRTDCDVAGRDDRLALLCLFKRACFYRTIVTIATPDVVVQQCCGVQHRVREREHFHSSSMVCAALCAAQCAQCAVRCAHAVRSFGITRLRSIDIKKVSD